MISFVAKYGNGNTVEYPNVTRAFIMDENEKCFFLESVTENTRMFTFKEIAVAEIVMDAQVMRCGSRVEGINAREFIDSINEKIVMAREKERKLVEPSSRALSEGYLFGNVGYGKMPISEYILNCLQEECSELSIEASKTIRFTPFCYNPNDQQHVPNHKRVFKEFEHVLAMMEMLYGRDYMQKLDRTRIETKKEMVRRTYRSYVLGEYDGYRQY